MNIKKELTKTVRTTRTYRFRIITTPTIIKRFQHTQLVQKLYFNYGLKYLYQHYGVKHLSTRFPSGKGKQYLIVSMVNFARTQVKQHDVDLKAMDYSVQSIDKRLEALLVNFQRYRQGQYKLSQYWSAKEKKQYLVTHRCQLSGYQRISYKHSPAEITSVALKQNHDRIKLTNNYAIKLPYFGNVQVKQSLTGLKKKKIIEAHLIQRPNGDFEVQVVTKLIEKRQLTKQQVSQAVGLDVNSKDDQFFVLSDGTVKTWDHKTKMAYQRLDQQARYLQGVINQHNHGNDGSKMARQVKHQISRIKAKAKYLIDQWQLTIAQQLVRQYPVLAMEQLNSFGMRISKRAKNYHMRKNTNHKLATIQPTSFRKTMEYIYQDHHCLLFEVNSVDTSKTCHDCHYINHQLKYEKHWQCPNCHRQINRDLNATYNIRDWALNPSQNAVLQQAKRFPWLNDNNLVVTY